MSHLGFNFDGELFGYNPYIDYTNEKHLEEVRAYNKKHHPEKNPVNKLDPRKRLVEKPCTFCGRFHVAQHWNIYVKLGIESPYCTPHKLLIQDNRGIFCIECNRDHLSNYFCHPPDRYEGKPGTGLDQDRTDASR